MTDTIDQLDDEGFDPEFDPDEQVKPDRKERGFLSGDVYIVCKEFVAGEFTLEEGKFLTPWVVATIIMEQDGLDKRPASGAIAAAFHRWEEWGFATFRVEPFAFVDFTEEGRELGLQGFMDKKRNDKKTSRK